MNKRFSFSTSQGLGQASTEANIFIHGYSSGYDADDRQKLLKCIPISLKDFTNIFAFWPSSHFARVKGPSLRLLFESSRMNLALGAAALVGDRATHFRRIRSRADSMGAVLLEQLDNHLSLHYPRIKTINLIGHSLGGRLIVSSLKTLVSRSEYRFSINDVLLMAAAVEVKSNDAQVIRSHVRGRLINAYSKADWTLLMNIDEKCLGRHPVEHFENIHIDRFGHSDYWERLPDILVYTQFKSYAKSPSPDNVESTIIPTTSVEQLMEPQLMKVELNTPRDIYQYINIELARIVGALDEPSTDSVLKSAQENAKNTLSIVKNGLESQLSDLEKNAEWNTYTIAFYGETGAGKSTIIETLRILLKEKSKVESQNKFRNFQEKFHLTEENIILLKTSIRQSKGQIDELENQIGALHEKHENLTQEALNTINRLQFSISKIKETASLWNKFLNVFRKMPEEKELILVRRKLPEITSMHDKEIAPLIASRSEIEDTKDSHLKRLDAVERYLPELEVLADGKIIGDGRPDFTRQTHRYDFKLNDQDFSLLDVPGIEGSEGLIIEEVERAVQTAHAVFYVTNQAAPPQTGEDQRKGTLQKIKSHLGSQTEVWTIFNKKVTNPKHSFIGRDLTSDDENSSLETLNEKMQEQLGSNYRKVLSLTALPAFLASTNNFCPGSKNFKNRKKILDTFSMEDIFKKSQFTTFLKFIEDDLVIDAKAKINRANFHKANHAIIQAIDVIEPIKNEFSSLSGSVRLDSESAKQQLFGSFDALKIRLEDGSETLIGQFSSNVRKEMNDLVENNLSGDDFRRALSDSFNQQHELIVSDFPKVIHKEIEIFRHEVEEIFLRFEEQVSELTEIFTRKYSSNFGGDFELNINIDNGLKVGNLIAVLVGGILMIWNPVGWIVGVLAFFSVVVGGYKAVRGFFSSKYKMAQQRKSTEDNLRKVISKLRESLRESISASESDMQEKIDHLEEALELPANQADMMLGILSKSIEQLKILSFKIINMECK